MDERIASGSYDAHKAHLVPFVQKLLGAERFPERLILTATAILDNNCFEISMPLRGIEMGGLFLMSLILCHDCVPNTKHFVNFIESDVDIQRYQMTFQTTGESKELGDTSSAFSISFPAPVSAGEERRTPHDHLHGHFKINTGATTTLGPDKDI